MSNRGIRRWALLGALASGALLSACEDRNQASRELDTWPKTGVEQREGNVNQGQPLESFGDPQPEQQPATGGSGQAQPGLGSQGNAQSEGQPQQNENFQGAPGQSNPREDGRGSEVLRDTQTETRNEGGEGQH